MLEEFVGAGLAFAALLAWEYGLKPARVRVNVAESLIAEIEFNMEYALESLYVVRHDVNAVPRNQKMTRFVFEALSQEFGELPSATTRRVIGFYVELEMAQSIIDRIWHVHDHVLSADSAEHSARLFADDARRKQTLHSYLYSAVRIGDEARKALREISEDGGWWRQFPPLKGLEQMSDHARRLVDKRTAIAPPSSPA